MYQAGEVLGSMIGRRHWVAEAFDGPFPPYFKQSSPSNRVPNFTPFVVSYEISTRSSLSRGLLEAPWMRYKTP